MGILKDWYSVQELIGLPGMPGSERGVQKWGQKNLDSTRLKARGKGLEYSLKVLPTETQTHLRQQVIAAVMASQPDSPAAPAAPALPATSKGIANKALSTLGTAPKQPQTSQTAPATLPAVPSRRLATPDAIAFDGSSQGDRDQALAAKNVLRWVGEIREAAQITDKAACNTLLAAARAGLLPDFKVQTLRQARDKRGRLSADGLPSVRSLESWLARQRRGESLVPQKPQPDMNLKLWEVAALDLKRRPQKPTTRMVHEQLVALWTPHMGAQAPSYDQVCYFFQHKFSRADLLVGQHLGSALAARRAFQKRSTADVAPFVEVHADGWNTHFNAPHPVTGEFVTLEVWHFHELTTRFVTRPSIGLSESTAVILAGLENYIREMGVPGVWQTDSTGSVKNKTVEQDPLVSIASRAGINIVHPVKVGNSQANGIAENWNTWIDKESRELATYQHPQRMDPLAFKQVRRFTDKMVKAAKAGDLDARDSNKRAAERAGKGLVFDSFAQAQDWINARVDKFNNAPHSALPKVTDAETGKRRHQSPREAVAEALAAGFEMVRMDEADLVDLFRLHFRRRVRRHSVMAYRSQEYTHADLAAHEGEEVVVAVDIMDGARVWVKDTAGHLICEAAVIQVTGYRSMSFYEASLEKRAGAQIKRLEKKADAVLDRMQMPALDAQAIEVHAAQVLPFGQSAPIEPLNAPWFGAPPAPGLTHANRYADEPDFALRTFGALVDAEEADRLARQREDNEADSFMDLMRQDQERQEEEERRRNAV